MNTRPIRRVIVTIASCCAVLHIDANVTLADIPTPRKSHVIAVERSAGPAMTFAAGELSRYLQTMTRQKWTIAEDADKKPNARIALKTTDDLARDGYHIRKHNGQIQILGGGSRGCMYGAYAWLHALGCRWPLPGKEYEIVPRIQSIDNFKDTRSIPAIRRRGMVYLVHNVSDLSSLDRVDFMAKNGFNYIFMSVNTLTGELRAKMASALQEREMGLEYGGHALPSLLPRDLFDEHPEYFRMDNGQRTKHLNMCLSSDDAVQIMADSAQKQFLDNLEKDFPTLETLHLWPDDLFHGGWCSCDKCKRYSESDQSLLILNRLAEHLQLDDVMLAHCAYHSSINPPQNVAGSRHIRLMYAPRERSYLKPLGKCKANKWYLDCLKGLVKAVPNEPEVFEYYHDLILFRCLPMPLHKIIGEDVKVYKAHGIDGIASLSFQAYDRFAYGPNTYILSRALWRGEGNPDDMREYCEAVYGPSAEAMETYFDMLFELCAMTMDTCHYDGFTDLRQLPPNQPGRADHAAALEPLVNDEHLDRIEEQLNTALREAKNFYRTRIRQQLALWRFARIEVHAIYEGIVAKPIIDEAMKPTSSKDLRTDAITRIEGILRGIDKATAALYQIPENLRGPFATKGLHAANERETGYKHGLMATLKQLKNRQN